MFCNTQKQPRRQTAGGDPNTLANSALAVVVGRQLRRFAPRLMYGLREPSRRWITEFRPDGCVVSLDQLTQRQ